VVRRIRLMVLSHYGAGMSNQLVGAYVICVLTDMVATIV
jgi:hypothetical protein